MRKPENIVYGTEDVPPPGLLAALSAQQVLVTSIFLVSPILVARAASLPLDRASDLIGLTMIGIAIGAVLQVRRWGPVGSGLLVIPSAQSAYLPGSLIAVRDGGLPALAGLLLASALLQIVLSRFVRRLRGVMPAELSGLIVLVVGLNLAQAGMDNVIGSIAANGGAQWGRGLLVALATIAVMVACTVWGRGPLRALGAIVGLVAGYGIGMALGLVDPASLGAIEDAPWLRLPRLSPALPQFDVQLLLPALVTALAVTLNSTGAFTAAQQLSDADWKRQDLRCVARGLLADGLGTLAAALLGGGGVAASGSSVALAANSRATSAVIGYGVAAGFLMLALAPRFALLMLGVPRPVLGAALIYLSCSLVVSGISIISSRLLDARKTFTLGIAFAFAVATPALARAEAILPEWMGPVLASPLLASALVALALNPLLRLGIRQQVSMSIPHGGFDHEQVARFVSRAGAAWAARREVIQQAQAPIAECLDTLAYAELSKGETRLTLGFNELALDARITWEGHPLPLSTVRPTKEELLMDDDAPARLAGYMITRLASQVRSRHTNGVAELHLVFDH